MNREELMKVKRKDSLAWKHRELSMNRGEEQRHTRLERQRIIDEQRRANESKEQRHTHLERQRIIDEERRAVESDKHAWNNNDI